MKLTWEKKLPAFEGGTRSGDPYAIASCGMEGLEQDIHPTIALGDGETTGWNGCIKRTFDFS